MPTGLVCNTPDPGDNPGAVFLACGPNDAGTGNIVYRLFYSETASAPADPTTATEHTFGSTGGDGGGTNPFGFNLGGLVIDTEYTFWLYQYDTSTSMFSVPGTCMTDSGAEGPPPAPAGFVANTPSGTNGEIFVAAGPNQVADPDIRYRLYYSPTATAPADPTTATEYAFGTTGGDGGGDNAFGFRLMGLIPDEPYTLWLYQYNDASMLFSAPSIRTTSASLPVEWYDPLTAQVVDNGNVVLQWSVSQQINNALFVIQHSSTGIDYKDLDQLEGAGNADHLIRYAYQHTRPNSGVNYYRVRQVDYDLATDYSNVAKVMFEPNSTSVVYPNPTDGEINIISSSESTVRIYDALGNMVHSVRVQNGSTPLDLSAVSSGAYILQFDDGRSQIITKR